MISWHPAGHLTQNIVVVIITTLPDRCRELGLLSPSSCGTTCQGKNKAFERALHPASATWPVFFHLLPSRPPTHPHTQMHPELAFFFFFFNEFIGAKLMTYAGKQDLKCSRACFILKQTSDTILFPVRGLLKGNVTRYAPRGGAWEHTGGEAYV